jgi:hypothetical protein
LNLAALRWSDKPIPDVGPNDALIRITTTTICGTDVHILKGEYPVAKGLTVGHEPVGVIEKLGSAVVGLHRRPARHCRGDLPQLQLLRRAGRRAFARRQLPDPPGPVRLPRLQGHRWLALWQPD